MKYYSYSDLYCYIVTADMSLLPKILAALWNRHFYALYMTCMTWSFSLFSTLNTPTNKAPKI